MNFSYKVNHIFAWKHLGLRSPMTNQYLIKKGCMQCFSASCPELLTETLKELLVLCSNLSVTLVVLAHYLYNHVSSQHIPKSLYHRWHNNN